MCSLSTNPSAVTVWEGPVNTVMLGKSWGVGEVGGCSDNVGNPVHVDSLCLIGSKAKPVLAL